MRTHLLAVAVLMAAGLSACVSIPASGTAPPVPAAGSAALPSAGFEIRPIEIGDWARETPQAIQTRFARSVERAVGRGETLAQARSALEASAFGCNPVSGARADDRPVQLCERQIRQSGCTHTWQVMLFDPGRQDRAASADAVYDRVCAGQSGPGGGLLGAPPG